MAPENNWLSFSLSSMEMLSSTATQQPQMLQSTMKVAPFDHASSSADSQQQYYYYPDHFYTNGTNYTSYLIMLEKLLTRVF